MNMLRYGACALAGLLAQAAFSVHAAPSCAAPVAAAVARTAGVGPAAAVAAACKAWPHDPATVLAAFAFDTGAADAKTLVVAAVDANGSRVARSWEQEVGEDAAVAFGDGSLAIDTAPYRLSAGVRAFGVRFDSAARGASCADAAWRDELTLFVADGAALRPVLAGLPMTRLRARKGCLGAGMPAGAVDEAKLSIGIAPTATHGYADLVVTARIEGAGATRVERHTLRYDGTAYRAGKGAPWWLSFFPLGG